MEKNQKQQQYYDRNERNIADPAPVFRGGHEAEEIVPGVPIVRSNTPRPSSFDAMISSAGYIPKSQQGELPLGFPAQAPSAPPLPEELEDDVDAIGRAVGAGLVSALPVVRHPSDSSAEDQKQILGLSFADVPLDRIPRVYGEDRESNYSSLSGMYTSPLISSQLPLTNPGQDSLLSQKEQHTEALPALKNDALSSTSMTQCVTTQARNQRWLIAFSLYLAGLVLILLLVAVVQGMGGARDNLTGGFTPLGVPWQVLIYGLLGGCISCIVSLSNIRVSDPPLFVMITWFTRPFIGSILALFSYILLTSGLFMLGGSVDRHPSFFWLAGTFAGLCEWWLFCRYKG